MSLPEDPKDNAVVMTGIAKSFGGVAALENVDFSVRKGEIHALLGGNGAGKSTVLKMLSGVHKPDKGEIWIGGVKLEEHTPEAARRLGIAMIFQEMSLIPSLSVAQNIFLTREPKGAMGLLNEAMRKIVSRCISGPSPNARLPITSTRVSPPRLISATRPGISPRST